MTFLRDLIHIPERVHQGDFVLKLSEGVNHADATLRDYVVTPQLVDAFDNALGFIKQSIATSGSKAAYLHGSFGAGKSHFMAVLNLLLAGNLQARSTPELADVVAKHGWTIGKKFLLVPYHMIGAKDMESAILGQYAEFVRKLHPNAPVPGFYLAEGLFSDAQRMREQMGEAAFFAHLNNAPPGEVADGGGWGDMEAGWDAARFEAATLEAPNGEERARLVGDLIRKIFTAYRTRAGDGESFVSLDDGLSIMTRHAQALGYDAVILFLDELVLWLASHAADVGFVSREGTKLVKLVEATNADRPIPLVSFVARQRDLRDLVGENLAGSVQAQFSDVLRHWEARFHRITLEDRNLPAIAEKRVLRPLNEAARLELKAAFESFLQVRKEVLDTLLTSSADRDMFQKVYPFSPALVETLIAVSAALQRERTALKLMMQLLVDRRGDLELGQLIPVGDLYDAISEGDEPFSEGMRLHFDNAKRLFNQRLLPMLERQHHVTLEAIKQGKADAPAAKNLRNDARLLKTLLLGALVPEVESLKGLTAQRLAALNHGTVRSPIPGREAQDVLRKCRDWASEIGEIKITEDQNPVVSIQVTGVDIEPILRTAEANDNAGNRRKKIREALFQELGVPDDGDLYTHYEFSWRGTRRAVELLYENVFEMTDSRLQGREGVWTVVLDFPFDELNRTPIDDIARLGEYRGPTSNTLIWLPSFFSAKALADLKRLVVLDYILSGERFDSYATHLSYVDKVQAKALAKNQLDSLRSKLRSQLEVAFGISSEPRDAITDALAADQQFHSLNGTFAPRPPVGANFKDAFEALLGQLLAHQYPAHPEFEFEIKPVDIRKIWPEVQRAIEANDRRGFVQDVALRRKVRGVISPCKLGKMTEAHLLIEDHWRSHFGQCHARDGAGTITVAKLRGWIDLPKPMGLPVELQNLIILSYAALSNRRFTQRGGPVEPSIDNLADELELREETLPDAEHWAAAVRRAASLFGLTVPQTLNAANVGRFVDELRSAATAKRDAVNKLVVAVRDRASRYGALITGRVCSAEASQALIASIQAATDAELVQVLANQTFETTEAAVGRSMAQAQSVADALSNAHWQFFDALRDLSDQRQSAAAMITRQLTDAIGSEEHVIPLKSKLEELERDAVRLLSAAAPSAPSNTSSAPPAATTITEPPHADTQAPVLPVVITPAKLTGKSAAHYTPVLVEEAQKLDLGTEAAASLLQALQERLQSDPELELSLSWRLQRRAGQA